MLIEHQNKRPNVDPTAYVASTAVICGNVTIGPRTHVSFGTVIEAHGACLICRGIPSQGHASPRPG